MSGTEEAAANAARRAARDREIALAVVEYVAGGLHDDQYRVAEAVARLESDELFAMVVTLAERAIRDVARHWAMTPEQAARTLLRDYLNPPSRG